LLGYIFVAETGFEENFARKANGERGSAQAGGIAGHGIAPMGVESVRSHGWVTHGGEAGWGCSGFAD
jgi:hypothetical protein